jgi:integrase
MVEMAHIRKLGASRYQARWLDPSNREKSKVFAKKSDAEKYLVAIQHNILSGAYIDPKAGKTTVGVMADQWLAGKINLKPTTRARYDSVLKVHVLPRWRNVPLVTVEHGEIQSWLAKLSAEGQSGASVRKAHGVLLGILALAVRDKRIPANPALEVELPALREKERGYLTPAEVADLARQAATLPPDRPKRASDTAFPQYRLAVLMLAYCGLRWSELAALRVRRVDLMRRRIDVAEAVTEVNGARLEWGTPKSHEARSVPIPRFLADELIAHLAGKAPEDLVFTSPTGGVLRNRAARRDWFDRAAANIGKPGLTPHELRHTAASLAVSAGANVKAVQRILGHASAVMTLDRYADLFDDDLDAVGDRLDAVARNVSTEVTELSRNLASVAKLKGNR